MRKAVLLSFFFAACAASAALAADKHGGLEVEVGKYHVELSVKDKDITVHVRDKADKPVDPKNVKASANVLSGKQNAQVQLSPAGAALSGQSPIDLAKDAKVIVTFAVGDAKPEQARFTLGAKSEHKGHKH